MMKLVFLLCILLPCAQPSHNTTRYYGNITGFDVCEMPLMMSMKHGLLAVFSVCAVFVGVLGNSLVILVIQYAAHLRTQPGYLLLTSLATADLAVSLFVTTTKTHKYAHNGSFCLNFGWCVFYNLTDCLFPITSITHLLVICANRFYAVTFSYNYHSRVTYCREKMVILLVWCYACLWTGVGMFNWDQERSLSYEVVVTDGTIQERLCYNTNHEFYVSAAILVFIFPVVVASFLYTILVTIAVMKGKNVPRIQIKSPSLCTSSPAIWSCHKNALACLPRFGVVKGAVTLIVVFASWVVCWLPHFSLIIVQYFRPDLMKKLFAHNQNGYDLLTTIVSNILPPLNSCVNPFIYFTTSKTFRHAIRDGYNKLTKQPRFRPGSLEDIREVFIKKSLKKKFSPNFEDVRVKFSPSQEDEIAMVNASPEKEILLSH